MIRLPMSFSISHYIFYNIQLYNCMQLFWQIELLSSSIYKLYDQYSNLIVTTMRIKIKHRNHINVILK